MPLSPLFMNLRKKRPDSRNLRLALRAAAPRAGCRKATSTFPHACASNNSVEIFLPELFCDFGCTACCLDLSLCGSTVSVHLNIEFLGKVAASDDLDAVPGLFDDTAVLECLNINCCAVFELLKSCDVNRNNVLAVVACEASLGESSVQRHLAAFKSRSGSAGTGLLSLVSITCGLSVSGSVAAAFSLFAVLGTVSRS